MPDFNSDPWVAENLPISAERLHAVGVIAFRWNECEFWLFFLFAEVSWLPQDEAWIHFYDLGDISVCTRIESILTKRPTYDPHGTVLILNVLKAYDIGRQNRNVVLHAWTRGRIGSEYALARRSKKPLDPSPTRFPDDLAALRKVADDLQELQRQMWLLACCLQDKSICEPMTWLEKLSLPDVLGTPPQPAQKRPKRPPQSSPA
jgi:hypothetical protein